MNAKMPTKIFVVDNDFSLMQRFKISLGPYKVLVEGAQDLASAQSMFAGNHQEVVVVDIGFREANGLALVQKWRESSEPAKRAISYVLLCQEKLSKYDLSLMTELLDIQTLAKPINPVASLSTFSRAAAIFQKQLRIETLRFTILNNANPEKLKEYIEDLQNKLQSLGNAGDGIILDLCEKHERWDEALMYAERCLQKDPKNIRFLYAKARFLQKLGRSGEALRMMEPRA